MRASGLRPSAQRLAVLALVAEGRGHPDAEAVFTALAPDFPGMSRTTVYNSLHALTAVGLLRELRTGGATVHYDLAPQPPHSHFVCRRCGRIADMDYPGGMDAMATGGYRVESVDVVLHGLCPRCLALEETPAPDAQQTES